MSNSEHDALIKSANEHLVRNYRQQPVVMTRGKGVYLWDKNGDRYLDMTAGIAVCALGHAHPALSFAIAKQASTLVHVSNLYFNDVQVALAKALTSRSFADRVFFCNSGAEANEAALKLARRYQQTVARAPDRVTILSTDDSFHGRSVGTVSVTGQEKYRQELGPLWGPVRFMPYGDIDAARDALSGQDVCAVIIEPLQGEGGLNLPPTGYLRGLRELCAQTGTILIFDEVQTGMGRTGTWFAYQQEDCEPDIMTLAKGLGGGVPIGAMLTSEEVGTGFVVPAGQALAHASTFGGNPLCCAAALAVIDTIDKDGLLENCRLVGEHLERGFAKLVDKHELAVSTHGRGLLRGVRLQKAAGAVYRQCREQGLLVTIAGGAVIRFAPALTVNASEIDEALSILDAVLGKVAG